MGDPMKTGLSKEQAVQSEVVEKLRERCLNQDWINIEHNGVNILRRQFLPWVVLGSRIRGTRIIKQMKKFLHNY